MPTIVFPYRASAATAVHLTQAFRLGLKETGFAEGESLAIEYRLAEGHQERMSALAADLRTVNWQ
jgi:putative ABC transport system substrate-binding protein